MRKSITTLLTIAAIVNFKTQNIYEKKRNEEFNIKSPQLTEFERYGNIPIKSFVGELDLSIPLVSLPIQNNNDVNISLAYNSSGFIPSKSSGIVGFNWSLVGEGIISREVVGSPDDQMGAPGTFNGIAGQFEHGLFVGIQKKKQNNSSFPSPGLVENFNAGYLYPAIDSQESDFYEFRYKDSQNSHSDSYETTPDIFHFNFNGISGSFFMDESGYFRVRTTEPNNFKIDISKLNFQPYVAHCIPSYTSEIIITDDKGIKYYFGGNSKNLEYTTSLGTDAAGYGSVGAPPPVITAWYMYKVEIPDGNVINYNYLDDRRDITSSLGTLGCSPTALGYYKGTLGTEKKSFIEFRANVNDYRKVTETSQVMTGGMESVSLNASYTSGWGNTYSLTKKSYLESITYNNSKIKFNYELQNNLYNNVNIPQQVGQNATETEFTRFPQKKMTSIQVFYNNSVIKEVNFGYQVITTGNANRVFLQSISQTGNKNYAFEYDLTSNTFPIPHTCAIDHWGFYNGKLSNDPNGTYPKLIPTINLYNNQDYTIASTERDPDFNYSKTAQITKITYPTKGYSIFEYEPHLYAKRLERRNSSSFLPSLFDVSGTFGGTRIKKINDYDLNNNLHTREFIYSDVSGNSTGILMNWPRYIFYLRAITSYGLEGITVNANTLHGFIQSSNISRNTLSGSDINYSSVIEKKSGNGSIESKFKTYIDLPDTFDGNTIQLTAGLFTPLPIAQNIYIEPNDKGDERGKLSERIIKNETGNTLSIEKYTYNESPSKIFEYTAVINISNAWAHARKMFYYNDFLSKKETSNYFNNTFVKNMEQYNYNYLSLLTDKSNTDADNMASSTFYKYATEKNNQYLIDKNMIGIPLEVEAKKNDIRISKSETLYPISQADANLKTSGLPLPTSVLSYDLQNNAASTELTYDVYDLKGNLQQYTTKDGVSTTIIWGYNGTQPIAKIEGAKLSDIALSYITSIVTASDTDNAAAPNNDETALLIALDNFRKDPALANYQITTYTYDPLIGVRSITPPSGIREVYLYDTARRLMEIREDNQAGRLIKEFKYNYKN
jgi:hypothetical protein